jgi:ArsR family transcriptional regulator, virulence genes transcriptional regulator
MNGLRSTEKTEDDLDIAALERRASEAANLLKLLANEKRLPILCHLAAIGEISVGKLAECVGLSQSALSQHLAKMRDEGLLATRREAQMIYYRIRNERPERLIALLTSIFCP